MSSCGAVLILHTERTCTLPRRRAGVGGITRLGRLQPAAQPGQRQPGRGGCQALGGALQRAGHPTANRGRILWPSALCYLVRACGREQGVHAGSSMS